MRKYLKFILSIIVLAVILQPLLTINEVDINAFESMNDYEYIQMNQKTDIESIQNVQVIGLYKQKIKSEVISLIWETTSEVDIEEISIMIFDDINKRNFGEIHSIDIHLIGLLNQRDEDIMIQKIAERLNLSQRKISIRIDE